MEIANSEASPLLSRGSPSPRRGRSFSTTVNLAIDSIFVIKFDIKRGNVIEYSKSRKSAIDLSGIEFKALPSGIHTVESDYV